SICRSAHHATACSYVASGQSGRRKAEPIAPLSDLGEKGSLVCLVVITPVAPAASAVRRIAPTFTVLLMPCSTTSNDAAGWLALKLCSLIRGLAASNTMPCGVFV